MVYLAFDLDGTIGNFLPVWKLLCPLRQNDFLVGANVPPISDELKWELDIAYAAFVKRVANAETSDSPLGLFRPGIFRVFEEVFKLRKKGVVEGVIMYTNNSSPALFNFASDVLQHHIGRKVFDDILDYRHPLRIKAPHSLLPPTDKRWIELKQLLTQSKAKAPISVEPKDVMFFDDMHHHDLIGALGPHNNYVKVSEYKFIADNKRLSGIFLAALKDSDALSNSKFSELLDYSYKCTQSRASRPANVDELIRFLTTTISGAPIGGISTGGPALNSPNLNAETMIAALRRLDVSKPNNNNNNTNIRVLRPRKAGTRKRLAGKRHKSVKRVFRYY
jgi:predicted phosphatase